MEEVIGEAQDKKSGVFLAYLPAVIAAIFTLTTIVLYSTVIEMRFWSVYVGMAIMTVVPFLVVLLNRKLSLGLPYYLIALMCLHAVLSQDMGTSLGFYGKFSWWDSSVHFFFGFLAAGALYYMYPRLKGGKPNVLDMIVMVLLVISFAAIWEVYEYVAGAVLNSDMQDVNSLMARGLNPISDTMMDITVAFIGSLVFFAVLWIVRKLKSIGKNEKLS